MTGYACETHLPIHPEVFVIVILYVHECTCVCLGGGGEVVVARAL